MPKNCLSPAVALVLALLCSSGSADIVTLKNGEKIEGKVASETATELQLEVKVSAGITDARTVLKSEVASVVKDKPDEVAWQPLKNLKLGPSSLPAASYASNIAALKGFIAQFPASSHLAPAQAVLTAFEEEEKRVKAGDVKLDGKWLSKAEVQKERYQINGLLAFNFMKEQAARSDLVGAMNTFDAIEAQFPGARILPDAVELAQRLVAALQTESERRLAALPAEDAQRRKALLAAPEQARTEMEAAAQREQAAADAAIANTDRLRQNWPPLLPKSERVLALISSRSGIEISRLGSVETPKLRESLTFSEKARAAFVKQETPAAHEALVRALELWPVNELATRLQTELNAARDSAAAVVPTEPPPAPVPAAPPTEATTATPTPATTAPPPAQEAPAAPPGAAADVPYSEPPPEEPLPEPEKPFLLRASGAITVVLLAALAAAALHFYKRRKRGADSELG